MSLPSAGQATTPALADFILLNEELAALARARIPLESNLARLGAQLPGKSGDLAQRIGRRLEAGEDFVSAIEAECASMPATYRAALVAGVASGNPGIALKSIVDSATRLDQLRHVTLAALLYPLVLVVLVCWLLTIVVKLVVPSFAWIENTPFRPIVWLAHSPATVPLLAVVAPAIVLLYAMFWWWRSGRLGGSSPRLGWLARLAGAGRIHQSNEAARFAELLHLLVERGLPLDETLRLAAEATGDRRLRAAALRMASEVHSGQVAHHFTGAGFPTLIRLALQHAGDRSLLLASLRQAAAMYQERTVRAAEWYTEYLPILLTIVIGGTFTIGFTLFVLWPYASMLYELSEWNWR
jgi:general secretion pathway protein F/type IV pilus assembly protein PilC